MLVQVRWTNQRYDYVEDFMLDDLIEAGGVASFYRASGWVMIGVDPIRARKPAGYPGTERRMLPFPAAEPEYAVCQDPRKAEKFTDRLVRRLTMSFGERVQGKYAPGGQSGIL